AAPNSADRNAAVNKADAALASIETIIEAIPNVRAAYGKVLVTVPGLHPIPPAAPHFDVPGSLTLDLEFNGGLGYQDIGSPSVVNGATPIRDSDGNAAILTGETLVDGAPGSANAVQLITLGNAASGTFQLSF